MRLDPEELDALLTEVGRSTLLSWWLCLWNSGYRDPLSAGGRRAMLVQLGAEQVWA